VNSDQRTVLFVSHAYPEDNVFAGWLADRLMVEGYDSWIDLRALKGGERIWPEAEKAIRDRAFRFLYVLSSASNTKEGTLQELELAKKIASAKGWSDFVIPLVVDDLRPADFNIRLTQLRPIEFFKGWGAGLADLLAKLESVNAPKTSSPEAAAHSWRSRVSGADRLRPVPERLYSNLLPLLHIPPRMFAFPRPEGSDPFQLASEATRPLAYSGTSLYSFETDPSQIHASLRGAKSLSIETARTRPREDPGRAHFDAMTALVRSTWEFGVRGKGLLAYEMANKKQCLFFPQNLTPDRVGFKTPDFDSWRSVTGISQGSFWHYGMSAYVREFDDLQLAIAAHVVFSDDGTTPWPSHEQQHRARRRIGRFWWNAKWRDLLLAATSWLAGGADVIRLECGSGERLEVGAVPTIVEAPFQFDHGPAIFDEDLPEVDEGFDPDTSEELADDDGLSEV
jgi:hypothetical protein